MKVIKPQGLGALSRVFENGDDTWLALTALVFFATDDARLLSEAALWTFAPGELGRDAALDAAMPKSRGEVLVCAKAYPRTPPQAACTVRVRLGSVDKRLLVVGDRAWRGDTMTAPEPFAEMPLTWERAFGGAGFAPNPLGRGVAPVRAGDASHHALPNVEHPQQRIASPADRPAPAGFGPLDFSWPQRFSKAGTYDARWLRERYPGFAEDIDWTLFNAAPDDQWIDGFFTGDEPFTVENLHPTKPVLEGRLPGVRARAFATLRLTDAEGVRRTELREVPMRADTVWLFPHAERSVLLFRGVVKIADDDADDVLHLVMACERLEDPPRPFAHYETVLAQRLDRERAHLYVLRDDDLMPPPREGAAPADPRDRSDMETLLAREGLMQKNLRRKAERELEAARAKVIAAGLDPAAAGLPEALPPEPPTPDPARAATLVQTAMEEADRARKEADAKRADAMRRFDAVCAEHGLDPDALRRRNDESGGPPRFSADGQLARMGALVARAEASGVSVPVVAAQLADPRFAARLRGAEDKLRELYVRIAHHQATAPRLDEATSRACRERLVAAVAARASVARMDVTGASLGPLSLAGADLRGVWMERADLTGADLTGADLTDAVLTRANLTGARLTGAKLTGANLGHADLTDATLARATLTGATLWGANLTRAKLDGATLEGADLMQATFHETDLSGAAMRRAIFLKTDLRGARFVGSDLTQAMFIEANLDGADLSGATLAGAVLLQSTGRRAVFRGARATNLRCVHESDFEGAIFHGATLDVANFRGTKLAGAEFSEASLKGADLSECDLRGARFYRAVAVDARFVRSDLTDAVMLSANLANTLLQKARMKGADLRGANLFGADMARFVGDARTDLTDANLTRVRFIAPRKRTPEAP